MKVKDLLEEILENQKRYGIDFLDWEVYTEQCDEDDKKYKRAQQDWKTIIDSEGWEYFECAGFWTKLKNDKIFTVNVNY